MPHANSPESFVAAADVEPLAFNWAFEPWWLVVLAALAAGAMVFYLYRAQRRIASKRVIAALTTIRIALMLLMFVLLAGPVYQRSHTSESGGTLWVVFDQSGSMDHADRQMSPVERLRWADGLGLLPAGARPSKLDRQVASLAALRADLAHLETRSQLASAEKDEQKRVAEFAKGVQGWNEQFQSLIGRVEQDPAAKAAPDGAALVTSLREAAGTVKGGVDKAADRKKFDEAAADVPWAETVKRIDAALAVLRPLSDQADQNFINEKQGDQAVQDALAKVAERKRIELAVSALTEKSKNGKTGLIDVIPRQNTKVVGFADVPQAVTTNDPAKLPDLIKTGLKPTGHSTNLAGALQWVNEQIGEDERASVVVVSDGRQNHGGDLVEPARLLASRDVRVFTVGIGSDQVAADATVEQVDAPDWIFKDDTLRASALLRLDGLSGKPVTVEFRREGQPPQTQTVTPQTDRATQVVTFRDKPIDAGMYEYEIAIKELPDETIKDNNTQRLRVTVKKDKLNALVIEDQPRWEYRYLTNYLERDQRVKLQKVLFQAANIANVDRPAPVMASPENKTAEAQLLPDTAEKWAAFDFIVLGDVPPERLTEKQQEFLAKAVTDRGATLLLIAGQFNMPFRYSGGDGAAPAGPGRARNVHDLLPVDLVNAWTPQEMSAHAKAGFHPVIAPEGAGSILSQFTVDESLNAQLWAGLPAWYWHSEQTRTKMAASVIWAAAEPKAAGDEKAVGADLSLEDARKRALLATMPVGLGRVMYLASDSTWRLRQVGGQNLHERLWGQVVRWVVGNDLPAGGRLVKFGTDKPRYVAGDAVTVTARVLGKDMAPLTGKQVKVVAKAVPADGKGEGKRLNETTLVESAEAPGYYKATLSGLPAGRVELALAGKEVEQLLTEDQTTVSKSLSVDVLPHRSDEKRNINADFAALARVAEAGGGIAVRGPHADVLAEHIPELNYTTENLEQVGLFSDPKDRSTQYTHWAFMILFVGLLTAEWVIRKAGGLV
ncbi:MAG: hypothetical protein AVDCRST_MAG64-445 [uncultured Phycisphaerae bacterium]|uniref:VWFA domain-containing protein n=1 Tax=uncultured Phycisphaerae bacterium TaxID=904963 RepID=A0A6J4N521_9BACT|nr:MAG: hypothetical protein AVDCRST_MAG64-445 [uncultured Phycisphaerae bacterium]